MNNDLIIGEDEIQRLKRQINELKTQIARLLQEKYDLENEICPALKRDFIIKFGIIEAAITAEKQHIAELLWKIHLLQAAINRNERISEKEIEKETAEKFKDEREKVKEEYDKTEKAKQEQKEADKKKSEDDRKEREWQKSHFSSRRERKIVFDPVTRQFRNSDGTAIIIEPDYDDDDEELEDEEIGEEEKSQEQSENEAEGAPKKTRMQMIKELYRKLVKRLHPDMNPNVTEREKELYIKAVEAYDAHDLETLQAIYDEVFGMEEIDEESDIEVLREIFNTLTQRLNRLREEIYKIKHEFPYTEKELLENEELVAKVVQVLNERFEGLKKRSAELEKQLAELKRKADNRK